MKPETDGRGRTGGRARHARTEHLTQGQLGSLRAADRSSRAGAGARGEPCLNWHQAQTEATAAAAGALLIVLTDNTTTVTLLALGEGPITARCQTIKISRAE